MSYKSLSIQETRNNLAEVIERVAIAGDKFIVTKFGKAKAIIVPLKADKTFLMLKDKLDPIWQLPKLSKGKKPQKKQIFSKDDQIIYECDVQIFMTKEQQLRLKRYKPKNLSLSVVVHNLIDQWLEKQTKDQQHLDEVLQFVKQVPKENHFKQQKDVDQWLRTMRAERVAG